MEPFSSNVIQIYLIKNNNNEQPNKIHGENKWEIFENSFQMWEVCKSQADYGGIALQSRQTEKNTF